MPEDVRSMEGLGAIRQRPLLEVPSYNMPYLRRLCFCTWTFGCNDRIGERIDTNRHQSFELMCTTMCAAVPEARAKFGEQAIDSLGKGYTHDTSCGHAEKASLLIDLAAVQERSDPSPR